MQRSKSTLASGSRSINRGSDSISTKSSRSQSYNKGSDSLSTSSRGSESIHKGSDSISTTTSRPNSAMKGSDSLYLHECDICLSQGKCSEAISYCTVCCEFLCQRCEHAHKGSKALSQHKLLTGSDMPNESSRTAPTPPIMFCDAHKTNIGNIYCKRHNDVICSTCQMTHHMSCETDDIQKQIAQVDLDESLRTTTKDLAELRSRFDGLKKKKKDGDTSTLKTQIKKCLDEMQQARKEIDEKLDKLEKEMTDEIRVIEEKIAKEMEDQITVVNDVLNQINEHAKSLDEYQKAKEADVKFVGMTKTNLRVNEFRAIFVKILKQAPFTSLRFKPHDLFTDILQRVPAFGTIVVEREDLNFSRNQTGLNVSRQSVGLNRQSMGLESQIVYGYTFMSLGK